LRRQSAEQVTLGEIAHVDQNAAELIAALALQFERAVEIFDGYQTALDQKLAEAHGRSGFGPH